MKHPPRFPSSHEDTGVRALAADPGHACLFYGLWGRNHAIDLVCGLALPALGSTRCDFVEISVTAWTGSVFVVRFGDGDAFSFLNGPSDFSPGNML